MKKLTIAIITIASIAILVSCGGKGVSFSVGVKKDLATGMSTNYNGLSLEEATIVDGDDNQLTGSELELGTAFSIVYQGISGFTLKDGNVFPGMAIKVTDSQGADVLFSADLFAEDTTGFSREDASVLRGSITVGEPMTTGGVYTCNIRIFDKNNAEQEITSTWEFKVK